MLTQHNALRLKSRVRHAPRETTKEFINACPAVVDRIMSAFAIGLGWPEDYFKEVLPPVYASGLMLRAIRFSMHLIPTVLQCYILQHACDTAISSYCKISARTDQNWCVHDGKRLRQPACMRTDDGRHGTGQLHSDPVQQISSRGGPEVQGGHQPHHRPHRRVPDHPAADKLRCAQALCAY